MSGGRYTRALASTPDDRCCSCGRGIYDMVLTSKINDLAQGSLLEDAEFGMNLCGLCIRIEEELIRITGSKINPDRVAAYRRMQERAYD